MTRLHQENRPAAKNVEIIHLLNVINGHCKMFSGRCKPRSILHISTTDLNDTIKINPLVRLEQFAFSRHGANARGVYIKKYVHA